MKRRILLWLVIGFLSTAFLEKRHIVETATTFLTGTFTEGGAIALYLSDVPFLAASVLWLLWRHGSSPTVARMPRLLLGAFLAWAVLRGIGGPHPVLGLSAAARVLQGTMLFLISADLVRHRFFPRALLVTLVIIGMLESTLGAAQVLRGKSVGLQAIGEPTIARDMAGVAKVNLPSGEKLLRAYGTLPHANVLGGLLVVTVGASFILLAMMEHPQKRRVSPMALAILAGLSIQMTGVLLTYSRSAYIAILLLAVQVFIIINIKRCQEGAKHRLILSMVALPILALLFFPHAREAFLQRLVLSSTDQSVLERIRIQYDAIEMTKSQPLVGVGVGQFVPVYFSRVPKGTATEPWQYMYPHSVPLVILAEMGIVGAGLALAFLFSLFWNSKRGARVWIFLLLPSAPILLLDHYLWTLQPGRIILWTTLGAIAGYAVRRTQRSMDACPTPARPPVSESARREPLQAGKTCPCAD